MALTAETAVGVAQQPGFSNRVKFFLEKAAIAVMNEASSTAGHADRVALAKLVLLGRNSNYESAVAVLSNSTLFAEGTTDPATGNGISDSDLEFAINSMFSAFAGYDPN